MGTMSLRELRDGLGNTVRAVAHTGNETIITDNGKEIAVIINIADYERLHEHADVVDALLLRDLRATRYATTPLADLLGELGVTADQFASGRAA